MTVGVYGIFCSATGKCLYIGQSKNIEDRWSQHRKRLRLKTHRNEFVKWYQEKNNNPDSVFILVLQETDNIDNDKNLAEIFWFKKLSPRFFGKVPSINDTWEHSEETRRKIGTSLAVKYSTENNTTLGKNARIEYEYKCEFCEKIFSRNINYPNRKFCSKECRIDARDKTLILNQVEIYNLYHVQKLSLRKIGEIFGISRTAISHYMEKNSIPRRTNNDKIYKELQKRK